MRHKPNILQPTVVGFAVVLAVLVVLFLSAFGEPNLFSMLFGPSTYNGSSQGEASFLGLQLVQTIAVVGVLVAFLAISVTSRLTKDNESVLVKQVDQAEYTLNALSQAVIRVDANGTPTYLNPAASRMLSLPQGQLPFSIELINSLTRKPLLPSLLASPAGVEQIPLPAVTRLITPPGIELEVEGNFRIVRDAQHRPLLGILQIRDVTEEREWTRRQPDLWDRDPLTALPGRNFMVNRLTRVIERERAGERPISYLQVKLDGIQEVYDEAGSQAGDALVRHLASLLRPHIRDTDLLARMDAGCFGALLTLCPEEVTERIRANIRQSLSSRHFHWEGKTYTIGVSVGCVRIPPFNGTVEELFVAAKADRS
jgi:diguanylate cyclase (GGDEF)-like protein